MAEETRISIRNERRDAIKAIEKRIKDKSDSLSEDQGKDFKSDVDDLTKSQTKNVDDLCEAKTAEIEAL